MASSGWKHSEEARRKMSEAQRKRFSDPIMREKQRKWCIELSQRNRTIEEIEKIKNRCKNKKYIETRYGTKETKFWRNVITQSSDECWIWKGCKDRDGYGVFGHNRKRLKAHRVSWELHNGAIPENMCICHHCDNPACVNPSHLFLGTNNDNKIDCLQKGRQTKGEQIANSKLTINQVREIINTFNSQKISYAEIGRRYNVAYGTISNIINRKTWKHVA